jgi:hypothetical protein
MTEAIRGLSPFGVPILTIALTLVAALDLLSQKYATGTALSERRIASPFGAAIQQQVFGTEVP